MAAYAPRPLRPPLPLTSLVGRERELAEIRALLDEARLLTLTGAGGSGKTRLALEALRRGSEADSGGTGGPSGGVAWVELASLADPRLVAQQIVHALGVREEIPAGDPGAALPFLPENDPVLLVLDNCEHLVEACAEVAETLLGARPALRILATSREALGVNGERAWLVPPLATPAADAPLEVMAQSEALRLFIQRARDASRTFDPGPDILPVLAEICRTLDGIPLAIELAAARVRVLSPGQIRDRLHDAHALLTDGGRRLVPRHRTLRAAIEWSHDLLPDEARVLLRRLSVFRGGFTLDAASEVALEGGDGDPLLVLDGVALLVDRSLLQVRETEGEARYSMLETVRQFAAQRLEASDEAERIRARHAHFVAREAASAVPFLVGGERARWMPRLHADLENVREAVRWSWTHEPRLHIAMVADVWWFWFFTRHWKEAEAVLARALELPEAGEPGILRARLLLARGGLAVLQGRTAEGGPLLEEALSLANGVGDAHLVASVHNYLALRWGQIGDTRAAPHADQALAWFQGTSHHSGHRMALLMSALVAHFKDDAALADRHSRDAIEVARLCGPADRAIALQNWSLIWALRGDYARAEPLVRASLVALQEDRSWLFLARGIAFLGESAGVQGAPLEAARLLGVAHAVREAIGSRPFGPDAIRLARLEPAFRAAAGEGAWEAAFLEGTHASLDEVVQGLLGEEAGVDPLEAMDRALAVVDRLDPARPPERPGASPGATLTVPGPIAVPSTPPGVATPDAASPGTPATLVPATPAPALRILTLGGFEVQGESVEAGSWTYARPQELLLLFLLHPRGVTRQEIGETIWPDATPAQVKNSFHVSLHHLRKRLGSPEWILLDQERYRLAWERGIEWDAQHFEEGIRAALRADPPPDPGVLGAILGRYGGPLLGGAGTARWIEDARDHFRQLQVDGLALQARLLEERGDLVGALDAWDRIVAQDELNEAAHRGLMRALAGTGARDRALRHFDRLRILLRELLDAEPEAATLRLDAALRSGSPRSGAPPPA